MASKVLKWNLKRYPNGIIFDYYSQMHASYLPLSI